VASIDLIWNISSLTRSSGKYGWLDTEYIDIHQTIGISSHPSNNLSCQHRESNPPNRHQTSAPQRSPANPSR
jgi:hypothetical protein